MKLEEIIKCPIKTCKIRAGNPAGQQGIGSTGNWSSLITNWYFGIIAVMNYSHVYKLQLGIENELL